MECNNVTLLCSDRLETEVSITDGGDEFSGRGVLQKVATCPGADRHQEILGLVVHPEKEHFNKQGALPCGVQLARVNVDFPSFAQLLSFANIPEQIRLGRTRKGKNWTPVIARGKDVLYAANQVTPGFSFRWACGWPPKRLSLLR
jgi:hypothetical protein